LRLKECVTGAIKLKKEQDMGIFALIEFILDFTKLLV